MKYAVKFDAVAVEKLMGAKATAILPWWFNFSVGDEDGTAFDVNAAWNPPWIEWVRDKYDGVTSDRQLAARAAQKYDGKVVRILSREEAKRRFAAKELRLQADRVEQLAHDVGEAGDGAAEEELNDVAGALRARADELWPAKLKPREAQVDACRIDGKPCAAHGGDLYSVHGREAEELRAGLERLIAQYKVKHPHHGRVPRRALERLLEDVDARDSLAFLETQKEPDDG